MKLHWVLGACALGLAAPAAAAEEPFDSIQGKWYDMQHKVAVEIVDNKVIVRELATSNITINKQNWAVGTVIAAYSSARHEGEIYWLSGQCWNTDALGNICSDNAVHYDRPTAKHWAIHLGPLTLWRRDHFEKADWAARD
jgi:hypothetical protein